MTIDDIVKNLDIILFKYNNSDKISFGFKAQDIDKLLPKEKFSIVTEDNNGYLMVDYSQITALLFLYCKDLKQEIDNLKQQKGIK